MSDQPLCVAMIIQSYYPRFGGAERQVGTLSPLLQSRGISVHVVTRRYPGFAPMATVNGVPVHRLPVPGPKAVASLTFTFAALGLFRRLRPDVIHAHELFSPATTAIAAKRLFGIPVVVTAHSTGPDGDVERLKRKFMGQARLSAFRRDVDRFVSINREIDSELANAGIPDSHRLYIPNGVDVRQFRPVEREARRALRQSLGLGEGPVVLFAGRLVRLKRVDLLLSIWPSIRVAHPDAELVIVGGGPAEQALGQMAGPGVRFIGPVQEVAPYLQAADLFVLPSETEGLSVALLEAMSVGLPVIAMNVGGNPGLIRHRENGWLAPANDAAGLQKAIETLLGDAECRNRLGQRAREHTLENFDLATTARRLHELYEELAGNR